MLCLLLLFAYLLIGYLYNSTDSNILPAVVLAGDPVLASDLDQTNDIVLPRDERGKISPDSFYMHDTNS